MTVEELNQLQQRLKAGRLPDRAECEQLLAELWRLKTLVASKSMELTLAREEASRHAEALAQTSAEKEAHRIELERLREVSELASCALEGLWSSCAVRIRKRAAKPADQGT